MNAVEIKRYALITKIRYPLPLIVGMYREAIEELCIHRNPMRHATPVLQSDQNQEQ